MPDTLIDPRLEADLAELLTPEPRQPWPVRIAAVIAIPAAIALLAALAATPLLTPATEQVVVIRSAPPQTTATPNPTPTATPTPTPPERTPTTTSPPITTTNEEEGWLVAAEGLAAAFAVDYLSWSQVPEDQRATVLAGYLAPGVEATVGWQTPGPLVAATPIVVDTQIHDEDRVTITVAVRVTGEETARWIRLAVPIGRDTEDRLAVTDLPHLALTPAAGSPPSVDTPDDPGLREAIQETVVSAVTEHLASLDSETGFTADAITLEHAHSLDANTAVAVVGMRVTDRITGAVLAQRLTVELHRTGGSWAVQPIR
jgi:hypothetical protein